MDQEEIVAKQISDGEEEEQEMLEAAEQACLQQDSNSQCRLGGSPVLSGGIL